ncbi:hypothetical protein [Nitrospira sp. BLG_2]|uniref:hypothetical protein n=1 Tax=Nitrospira sp. BLG_2 TaxID=3397507 RepID=UPI003B9D88F4
MRPLWWTGLVLLALLGNADTVRDWFFPQYKDQEIRSFFPSGIPWPTIAWIGVVLLILEGGYRAWSKQHEAALELEIKLCSLITPKLSIRFSDNDNTCISPPTIQHDDAGNSSTFRRVFIVVKNESAIPLTDVQVYCEKVVVANGQPAIAIKGDYRPLILGGSSFPRDLAPWEPHHVGVVREIVDTTSTGVVTGKRIELHIPLKCVVERTLYGKEFRIDVIVHAKEETTPRLASYTFGWSDKDEFFFESREVLDRKAV